VKVRVIWSGRKALFLSPVSPEPRTAVLIRGFRASGNIRVFPQGWCEEADAFRPAAIAGSKEQLTALLDTPPASVTHALIRLLRPGENLISDAERNRFWRVFGVPLFEQIVDRSGRAIAKECEAHDGLHVDSELGSDGFERGVELEGYRLDESPCGCGSKTPRLRAVAQPELEQAAAAGTL
jgi:hypothetical protein